MTAGEHTQGSWQISLSDQQVFLRLRWPVDVCLRSRITDTILSFNSHAEIWTHLFAHVFSVYDWLSELTYIFFPVICWSYMRREMYDSLSISNKLYSCHHLYFSLSRETTLLRLSRDHSESAKFILGTQSLTKLVYYNSSFPVKINSCNFLSYLLKLSVKFTLSIERSTGNETDCLWMTIYTLHHGGWALWRPPLA